MFFLSAFAPLRGAEVNLDHPVIDKREDGIYMYFHDLPPILFDDPIHFSDDDLCPDWDTP